MAAADRPVVFLHVMKCGGTSVRVGLASGLSGRAKRPEVFELDGVAAKRAAAGNNADNWRFRDALLPYVLETMRPRLVVGHFRYCDRYEDLLEAAHFVTVLRDPIDRLISLYRYRRYKEGVDVPVTVPLEEFIEANRWIAEGHKYVDTFSGRVHPDPCSDDAIEAAVRNLQRFAAVGFTHDLAGFARRVGECAHKTITFPLLNRSPAPEAGAGEISPAVLERMREVCRPDIEVYERLLAAAS